MKATSATLLSKDGYERRIFTRLLRGGWLRCDFQSLDIRNWETWKSVNYRKAQANELIKGLRAAGWLLVQYNPVESLETSHDQAIALFHKVGIGIDPKKHLAFVDRDGDTVIGALYLGVLNYGTWRMSFDVAVADGSRGRGVGKKLIKAFDDYYLQELPALRKRYGKGFFAEVFVVNPRVEKILGSLGYRYGNSHGTDPGDGCWMYKE
jgi:GNAT superfamily N-acetyltransferase